MVWWIWFGGGLRALVTVFSLFSRKKLRGKDTDTADTEKLKEVETNESI